MSELTEEQKQIFKAAAERRKANGIKLRQFRVLVESNAAASLSDFWNGWVETLGKEHATDYLLLSMRKADEALRSAQTRRKRTCK